MSNLPQDKPENRSDSQVSSFFDRYFTKQLSFPSNQVDAVVGFFESRGFQRKASVSTTIALLEQSKLDDINVFELLDTLKGLSDVQLSAIVTEVLNYKRPRSSSLGYKQFSDINSLESRNIDRPSQDASGLVTQDYIEAGYVEQGYVENIS